MHLPAPTNAPRDEPETPALAAGELTMLIGSWAAVRWEYVRPDGTGRVDIVGDLGGTVTLSVGAGTYLLSCDLPKDGPRSVGGTVRETADLWIDFAPQPGRVERVGFKRAGGTLVLRSQSSGWDFSGGGEEPADFTAVLVRL